MLLLIVILINFSWVDSTLCERRVKEFLGSEQPIRIEPTNSGIRVIQFGKTIAQYPKTCQELIAEIPPPPAAPAQTPLVSAPPPQAAQTTQAAPRLQAVPAPAQTAQPPLVLPAIPTQAAEPTSPDAPPPLVQAAPSICPPSQVAPVQAAGSSTAAPAALTEHIFIGIGKNNSLIIFTLLFTSFEYQLKSFLFRNPKTFHF